MIVCLVALLAAAPARKKGWDWRQTMTPHFKILHQSPWLPPGLAVGMERVHFRLRMDLGAFSPWMAKERISLYVYRDLASYVQGEFNPPPWSNGVAVYDRKAVAMPAMQETSQMLRILSHETAHLLFVSYFRERRRDPPRWLNEGLAMVEEAESRERPETSLWYESMVDMKPAAWLPMARFFEITPTEDLHDDKAQVAGWYVQAYSVIQFLVRRHTSLQFKSFCAQLRDGKAVPEALWLVFRYRSVGDFERQWRLWLADPVHRRRAGALRASRASGGRR